MPLYTLTTRAGTLDADAKARLADQLTTFHADYAGVAKNWVHVVYHDYVTGSGYTAGVASAPVVLTLLIRTGRSPEYKRVLLRRLWEMVQAATGAPDQEIVIGIQEVPASQAMEMAQIMPDVGEH